MLAKILQGLHSPKIYRRANPPFLLWKKKKTNETAEETQTHTVLEDKIFLVFFVFIRIGFKMLTKLV